jgi:L-ribulokinase
LIKDNVSGVNFGTDSLMAVLIDSTNGAQIASEANCYQRWRENKI